MRTFLDLPYMRSGAQYPADHYSEDCPDGKERPGAIEIRHFLSGKILRCTGYIKILEAVKRLV
jgi:hypothetical protein